MDWKKEIIIANLVKRKVVEADTNHLWQYFPPRPGATEQEIKLTEDALGLEMDEKHRLFLMRADGWPRFYQDVDVFGTTELRGGPVFARAQERLRALGDVRSLCGFDEADLLPIAGSVDQIDVFAITKFFVDSRGIVFWFANGLIDRFVGFDEWFLAMVDYNRLEYQRLSKSLRA